MPTTSTVKLEDDANEIVEAIKSLEDFNSKEEAINHIIKQFKQHNDDIQKMLDLKN